MTIHRPCYTSESSRSLSSFRLTHMVSRIKMKRLPCHQVLEGSFVPFGRFFLTHAPLRKSNCEGEWDEWFFLSLFPPCLNSLITVDASWQTDCGIIISLVWLLFCITSVRQLLRGRSVLWRENKSEKGMQAKWLSEKERESEREREWVKVERKKNKRASSVKCIHYMGCKVKDPVQCIYCRPGTLFNQHKHTRSRLFNLFCFLFICHLEREKQGEKQERKGCWISN